MLKDKVQINLLGKLTVHVNGRTVSRFRTYKTGVLLALLAYYPDRHHPREELIEMLWGDCEPLLGRNSLSQSLSSLRRQLEPPDVPSGQVLRADRYKIELNRESVDTDVARFIASHEKFRKADGEASRAGAFGELRASYSGEFLPGFYEDWCVSERDRIGLMYLEALRDRIEQLEEFGDCDAAAEIAADAVRIDPLDEDLHFALIRLYAAAGQRTKAINQFEDLSVLLEEELGVEPSGEIADFVDKVRSGDKAAIPGTRRTEKKRSRPTEPAGESTNQLPGLVAVLAIESNPSDLPKLLEIGAESQPFRVVTDGHLASLQFSSASDALTFAASLQKRADEIISASGSADQLRMALMIGEIKNGSKAAASKLEARTKALLAAAKPGQFLCSETVASLLSRDYGPTMRFRELGSYEIGSEETSQRVFQVDHNKRKESDFGDLEAQKVGVGRLPVSLSQFFGREREIRTICGWIDPLEGDSRLVTLTGPGGTGKTRLSLELAKELQTSFNDRVYFVPLASVDRGELVAGEILEILGGGTSSAADPLSKIQDLLLGRRTLLILDNLEHLLLAEAKSASRPVRELIESLLTTLPDLTLLATSRNSLSISGEREFFVEPLPVPSAEYSSDQILESESVKLFLDRAQAVRPTFQATDSSVDVIGRICSRLEGIPLALELAAAQVQVLTLSRIEEGLARRLDFLVDEKRQPEKRHQHLRETIDWSFNLLPEDVCDFFCDLSVFRGGADVSDLEKVLNDPMALDHLAFLEEASFLTLRENEASSDMRFEMLETLREYGSEKLAPERLEALRAAHAARYLEIAESAAPQLKGEEQSVWLRRLDVDLSNTRAALEWFSAVRDVESGARIGIALERFWQMQGLAREGLEFLDWVLEALAAAPIPDDRQLQAQEVRHALGELLIEISDFERATEQFDESRILADQRKDLRGMAKALNGLGRAVFELGDYEKAYPYQERSLELWREIDDDFWVAAVQNNLGLIASERSDYPTALEHYKESLRLRRKIGDMKGIATVLNNIGIVSRRKGDYERAKAAYQESLEIREEMGDIRNVASSLSNLSWVAENVLDYDRAEKLQKKALKIRHELEDEWGVALSKNVLAILAHHKGKTAEARSLFEESIAIRRSIGNKLGLGESLFYFGGLLTDLRELDEARQILREAIEVTYSIRNRLGIAGALEACSKLALAEGDPQRSIVLLFAARRLRDEIGARLTPSEERVSDKQLSSLGDAVTSSEFNKARELGLSLTFEQAREFALSL